MSKGRQIKTTAPAAPPGPPHPHPACQSDDALLAQCEVRTGRSGGPGGQNRNKVETFVEIRHVPTDLRAHAGERRSQIENKHVALRRLREALALHVRVAPPKGRGLAVLDDPPGSALWRSRVMQAGRDGERGGVIACNPDNHDYPCLLAEALDTLAEQGWDPRRAGDMLGVTPSQIVKLVAGLPAALAYLNARRREAGQGALKA